LVTKGLWNIMQGHYNHPPLARNIIGGVEEGAVVVDDVAGFATTSFVVAGFATTSFVVAGSDDARCTPGVG